MDEKMFFEMIRINGQAGYLQYKLDCGEKVSYAEIQRALNVILEITSKYAAQYLEEIEEG